MKKILSAALALVCIWFASPAFADLDPCRNLFDGVWQSGIYSTTTGVYSSAENRVSNKNMIAVQPDTKYVASGDGVDSIRWLFYDSNKAFIRAVNGNRTITTPNGTKYINIYIAADYTVETAPRFQIEQGDTATDYVPYNPNCIEFEYTSATGTVSQAGTPTPENPIEPVFYQQGNMILRRVGDYADSYDATTGKITRRIGVKVFNGTEALTTFNSNSYIKSDASDVAFVLPTSGESNNNGGISNRLQYASAAASIWSTIGYPNYWTLNNRNQLHMNFANEVLGITDYTQETQSSVIEKAKAYLKSQYDAGTPYVFYYTLATPVEEDWTETSYRSLSIKIATTKYNETKFSPLNTALQNAISVVDTVVSNTITQAGRIATLQTQKQTRPNDIADDNEKCPAGKKCLLVEDASGTPHWYEIVENAWDLPVGYTQLQWIKSTGAQWIDTGIIATNWDWSVEFEMSVPQAGDMFFGAGRGLWGSADWGAQFGLANSSGNANWGFGSGGMNVVISNLGVRTDTFYNYKMTKEGLYVNGELKSRNTATESFSNSDLSLWICKTNNPGTSGYNRSASSWKYVRIYNADTALVFNGVPAKNPDGKIGMYDKVSGEFFENKGTGDFIAGPVAQ